MSEIKEGSKPKRTAEEYAASLGIVFAPPDPVLQRDLEAFFKAHRQRGGGTDSMSSFEQNGASVRAACDVGWINGLTADDVDTTRPPVVTWLAGQVNQLIIAAWDVPGE